MGNQRPLQPFEGLLSVPQYALTASNYEPEEQLPRCLRQLDRYLIADLLDAITKFGVVGETESDRELILRAHTHPPLYALAQIPDDMGMTSIKLCLGTSPQALRRKGARIILRKATLFWPLSVSVAEVRERLRRIDQRMFTCGFLSNDGIRTDIYDPHANGTLNVEDYFPFPETVLRYPPNGLRSDTFLQRFDDPDGLARIRLHDGSLRICLTRDVEAIMQRDEIRTRVRREVYRKHGIESIEDLENLDNVRRKRLESACRREEKRAFARLERG